MVFYRGCPQFLIFALSEIDLRSVCIKKAFSNNSASFDSWTELAIRVPTSQELGVISLQSGCAKKKESQDLFPVFYHTPILSK